MSYALRPIIDADSFVWAACSSAKGPMSEIDVVSHIEAFGEPPRFPDGEPVENVLNTLKLKMEFLTDMFDHGLSASVYLTGKDNYRYGIAVTKPYKGNRKQEKPLYFEEAREYLCKWWKAKIVDGQEADDACGIEQCASNGTTCIISLDKDLLGVPGYNLRPRRDGSFDFTEISVDDADKFFWTQMLTGDMTDNIPGIAGIGNVKAAKILLGCSNDKDYRRAVTAAYEQHWHKHGSVLSPAEGMIEQGRLLWIRRAEGQLWE